jgi:hypothetical protein
MNCNQKNIKIDNSVPMVLGIFIAMNILSAIYILITDEYNGDYYGVPVNFSFFKIVLFLILTTIPYVLLYKISKSIRINNIFSLKINIGSLRNVIILIMISQIYITHVYQVGIIGMPPYEADGIMKYLILFLNRFQPFYLGSFLILILPKKSRLIFFTILLMITIGLMRGGLGGFMYVSLALIVRYSEGINVFVKKYWLILVLIMGFIPFLIYELYQYRSALRGDEIFQEYSIFSLLTGIFIGRMSSLTNTMIIAENINYFSSAIQLLEELYFPKQLLAGVLGVNYAPNTTPQNLLINMHGTEIDNFSYMTGVIGDLIMGGLKNWYLPIINILLILLITYITFYFASLINFKKSIPLAFALMIYPFMSGVPGEMIGVTFFYILIVILILLLKLFKDIIIFSCYDNKKVRHLNLEKK